MTHAHRDDQGGQWGDMIAGFARFPAGFDATTLLGRFPDRRCPCPHWGYVLTGEFVVRYADHEETVGEGDAYYLEPGHAPLYVQETEVFEISPAADLARMLELVASDPAAPNVEAFGAGPA